MPRIKRTKIHNYETARVVADMLIESTGTHFLDSGGMSGRMWQRNQEKVRKHGNGPVATFEDMPESKFGWPDVYPHSAARNDDYKSMGNDSGTEAELWVSHHIYHWLKAAVDYNPVVDRMLDDLAAQMDEGKDHWDKPSWFEIYREFPQYYARQMALKQAEEDEERLEWNATREGEESEMTPEDWLEAGRVSIDPPTGPWDSSAEPEGYEVYTYNEENCLSQDIHFIYFEHESISSGGWGNEGIALIMIHNGADARGGFTRPRAFTASTESDGGPGLFDYHRATIACTECMAYWDDDGSGNWNGSDYADNDVLHLKDYNARDGDALDAAYLNAQTGVLVADENPWIVIEQGDAQYPSDPGVKVWCPVCGKGELRPYFN